MVLEDDNFVAPTFLADNLGWMAAHDVAVVVNNQWLEVPGDDPAAAPRHAGQQANTSHVTGPWTADDFRLALLWGLPLSNGSVFWRHGCRTDFGRDSGHDPALHEWLRAWRLADPVYFNATPNAFWYPSLPDGARPRHVGMGVFLQRERALMAMRRSILADLARRGETQKLLSGRYRTPLAEREEAVVRAGGRWPGPSLLPRRRRASLAAKALALRLLMPAVPL